ncbi:hypothetical protein NDU88_003919 [Pleurodeles waltl]|uniref:Uncharacterized protein n=1 Tax=Pleurodeles waltl TaxID=8319 RepID=A0AAV7V1G2_PLEWA|nr:hypothetical protein NDU88_003919 [Pleurodeles waltl]
MPKMAPDPLGPAPAPRAPGVARRSPCSARVADAPPSLRTRAERAGAGRARRERGWSREGSSPCPSPHPARALGARPRPSSTPRGTLGPRQTLRTPRSGHRHGRVTKCAGGALQDVLVEPWTERSMICLLGRHPNGPRIMDAVMDEGNQKLATSKQAACQEQKDLQINHFSSPILKNVQEDA